MGALFFLLLDADIILLLETIILLWRWYLAYFWNYDIPILNIYLYICVNKTYQLWSTPTT